MLVAGVQMAVSRSTRQENVEKAERYVREAAENGAQIVCLQEYFSTGCFTMEMNREFFELAETVEGPTITRMASVAEETGIWLIAPIFEKDLNVAGRYYDSAIVIDPTGDVRGSVRKRYLPLNVTMEKYYFVPGGVDTPVFDVEGLQFGIVVCYERHFFEIPRLEVLKGADVLFIPNSSYRSKGRDTIWEQEYVSMAANNGVYVVAVNSTGFGDGYDQFGHSLALDPYGKIMSQLGEEEGILYCEISRDKVEEIRIANPISREYRRDVLEKMLELL